MLAPMTELRTITNCLSRDKVTGYRMITVDDPPETFEDLRAFLLEYTDGKTPCWIYPTDEHFDEWGLKAYDPLKGEIEESVVRPWAIEYIAIMIKDPPEWLEIKKRNG